VHSLLVASSPAAVPVHVVSKPGWPALLESLPEFGGKFAQAQGFAARPGQFLLLPDTQGGIASALLGVEPPGARRRDPFAPGRLAALLPAGDYALGGEIDDPGLAALAWLLQAYRFDRYRKPARRERIAPARAGRLHAQ
jgi:leucyl aminopeptidase